ncbi:acyl-CoA dehydrogenase family protein [Nocardioides sp. YIM 152315]|uniref:acyl-CoA dehydrogenase family protein n=1 Tax=Nocardioides sp. YIM 152315 TaxID=3031760 RepID=UPI0023DAE40A|nr:acyl-CoA dehydrogenase family protein [Nocardioides sp. YIM 152315]MDF1602421.1 acyl-CoA dehydrogenase family protein [Nocardioides sp. YIM 152315]
MTLLQSLRPGGRHGLATTESRDPIGYAVAALARLAQSDVLDRLGIRKQTEQAVFTATRGGFRTIARASRAFDRSGTKGTPGARPADAPRTGVFDLTPSEDEQLLVDVVTELATDVLRPAAAGADDACAAPDDVLKAGLEVGLPILGLPESLGGVAQERSAVAGALVAEALAKGDLGLAVASLAPGAVATAIGLWGTDAQQQTYLPAFAGGDAPVAALALTEPTVLFDALRPSTSATRTADGFVLEGVKSAVPRGADAELFVVGATLDERPVLFLVEGGTAGLEIEADPAMGVRAAGLCKLHLREVTVPADAVLGGTDGTTSAQAYVECVRLSRLAWCALGVGVGQAVLDYVTPYVKEREAFGEPIAHRQSVAFMVANMAIELQAMRLLTWKAASRAAAGKDVAREVALARRLCADRGMQIGLDGVQLLGGHGFVKEHPVERWYRDLRAIGVMEGGVLV